MMLGLNLSLMTQMRSGVSAFAAYAVDGIEPDLVADFVGETYGYAEPVLGPELVTNGTFDTDTTGWTNSGTGSASWDAGSVSITGAHGFLLRQNFTVSPGTLYFYSYEITEAVTGGFAQLILGTGTGGQTAVGTYSGVILASGTDIILQVFGDGKFDNVSVREVIDYRAKSTTFDGLFDYTGASLKTMVDSDGVLKWAPHNLLRHSEDFSNAAWIGENATVTANAATAPDGSLTADRIVFNGTVNAQVRQDIGGLTVGSAYTLKMWVRADAATTVRLGFSAYSAKSITTEWQLFSVTQVASSTAHAPQIAENGETVPVYVWGAHAYRSDLGGMVDNPDRGDSYVPTTTAAVYLPRRGHHTYNGSAWVNKGILIESEARTNLLLNSGTLATQDVTVTAVPHTLSFTGTGTVTLSGASTDGPLVGTGTGENNRVNLTFTPTAGTLTCTVTGTVTNAQLEVGSTPSSFIPTAGATVTRAAETLTIASGLLPFDPTAMSIAMDGEMTYADLGTLSTVEFFRWFTSNNDRLACAVNTNSLSTGVVQFYAVNSAVFDAVETSAPGPYSPGVNVEFNIAGRYGENLNGAIDGTALTENATPTGNANLSATTFELARTYNGTVGTFRMWGGTGLTDAQLEEATT